MAGCLGAVAGLLDLGLIFARRDLFHASQYYEQGRHFIWVVPLVNLGLMLVPALLMGALVRIRPGAISERTLVWLLATLAFWGPFSRMPLYSVATLLLAAGFARVLSGRLAGMGRRLTRVFASALVVFVAAIALTAVVSIRKQARAEASALALLPAAPADARNVILIVMDTVRARSLSLHGYHRETTPEVARWARRGTMFERAVATAPWTFPSHSSFLTGQWPSVLGAHWRPTLDPNFITLAEYLSTRGYETAGFAANTFWCSYESRMDRGFSLYEDYPLNFRTMLGSTVPGRWLLERIAGGGSLYAVKWIRAQSRDAAEINRSFLDWLSRERPTKRPFFAFLNYLDAHEPFLPPRPFETKFGLSALTPNDSRQLLDYWDRDKRAISPRDVELARDAYDRCITALDQQIGALLDELDRRGTLDNTLVIVTSDHGEQFGEHGVFNHGFSLYEPELHVPLVMIGAGLERGRTIADPVSLRDLPATVIDFGRPGGVSPFSGKSLLGREVPGKGDPARSQAASEVDIPMVIGPERGVGSNLRGFAMSLVDRSMHYLLDVRGTEELYDWSTDPAEARNLRDDPAHAETLTRMRVSLATFLSVNRISSRPAAEYQNLLRRLLAARLPPPRI